MSDYDRVAAFYNSRRWTFFPGFDGENRFGGICILSIFCPKRNSSNNKVQEPIYTLHPGLYGPSLDDEVLLFGSTWFRV
jgi:hypothetical protein